MGAVWAEPPASARDVLDRIGGETGWAYTTVKTLMARLVEKGVLEMSMRGNVSLYTPLITRRQARVAALSLLVDKAFDGAFGSLVQHLVTDQKLSKKEKTELARVIRELDKEGRGTK